jgi:hypothetical protein
VGSKRQLLMILCMSVLEIFGHFYDYRLGFSLELYVAWLKLVLMLPDGLEK